MGTGKHRSGGRREAARWERDRRDPLELIRSLRRLAGLAGRDPNEAEYQARREDVVVRAAAQDPAWDELGDADRAMFDTSDTAAGMRRVVPGEMSDRELAFASLLDEIRRLVHRAPTAPTLTEGLGDRLRATADELLAWLGDPAIPLTPQEQRIWDLLLKMPEDRPLSCRSIVMRLQTMSKPLSEENARKSLSTTLKAKGVQNRRGAGYFIPREFRRGDGAD